MTKTYGLALGGGGARGFAHIGVLQYIQEHAITIDEVAGASMGALVAAMYATGMSHEVMQHTFSQVSYTKWFDGSIDTGIFGGKKFTDWLTSIFGDTQIQDCSLPLKIVACDIQTGEKIVFEKGSIVDAVRASTAFPGLLSPLIQGDNYLMDGGIVDNLPIDLLENNNIIAVSVVDNLHRKIDNNQTFWGVSIPDLTISKTQRILNNAINIMLQRIEDLTIKASDKDLVLIRPQMHDYSMFAIDKLSEIVTIGYEEMARVWEE